MAEKKYSHVAVIGIDGMGNFNRNTPTPIMDSIFAEGAQSYFALSKDPTISAQNWGAMLLGTDPEIHGLTNSIVSREEYTNTEIPSIFTMIRRKYPDAYLASCCNWDPINYGIIEHNIGVDMMTADNDDILCPMIEETVAKKPVFLFVQFDDVDGAGHGNWYGTPGHLERITKTDVLVGRIYDAYKKAGIIDDTLFIVIADHGGYRGGHGGYTDGEKYVYFAIAGKTVNRCTMEYAETKDIAATVLYALGVDIPDYNPGGFSSQVPAGVFDDTAEYIMPGLSDYIPKGSPTGSFGGEGGLTSFADKDKILMALFFDDSIADEAGKCSFTEHGHVKYYSNGIKGAMGELGATGYLTCDGIDLNGKSFTFCCWLKIDPTLKDDICVAGTAPKTGNGYGDGFALALRGDETRFSITRNDEPVSFVTSFRDNSSGWIHVACVVDADEKVVKFYNNFAPVREYPLGEDSVIGAGSLPFTIGNDASGSWNDKDNNFIFNMDDFILFSSALEAEEIEKLGGYYR